MGSALTLVLLTGFGLIRLLTRAFLRPSSSHPSLRRARFVLSLCVVLGAISQIPVALCTHTYPYLLWALWWFGSSFLALLLVTWRAWFAFDPDAAHAWAPMPPMVLLLIPAALLSTGLLDRVEDVALVIGVLYYLPGLKGLCPAVLLMLLIAEALVRRRLGPRASSTRGTPG